MCVCVWGGVVVVVVGGGWWWWGGGGGDRVCVRGWVGVGEEGVQGQACQVDMGAVKPVGQHKLLNTTKLPEI